MKHWNGCNCSACSLKRGCIDLGNIPIEVTTLTCADCSDRIHMDGPRADLPSPFYCDVCEEAHQSRVDAILNFYALRASLM